MAPKQERLFWLTSGVIHTIKLNVLEPLVVTNGIYSLPLKQNELCTYGFFAKTLTRRYFYTNMWQNDFGNKKNTKIAKIAIEQHADATRMKTV
jgi:hypothetical protein